MKTSKISVALIALCVVAFVLSSMFTLTACGTMYRSNPGTKEQMAGTYKLTTYIQKDENDNDIDRIEQLSVKAYMVVGADGYGYYAYQDKNTDFWYDSTVIRYSHDDERPELYDSIRFSTGRGHVFIDEQKPGCGYEPTMGFNSETNTFNYFIPNYKPTMKGIVPSYYTDVVYTKISNDTDLTKVASEFNTTLAPLPQFELKNLNGVLIFHAGMPNSEISDITNPDYNKYKYYIVDFDAVNKKADIYYELVEGDEGAKVEQDVSIEVTTIEPSEQNSYTNQVVVNLLNNHYLANLGYYSIPTSYLNYDVYTEPDAEGTRWNVYSNRFEKYINYDNKTIEQIIQEQLDLYNNSLE